MKLEKLCKNYKSKSKQCYCQNKYIIYTIILYTILKKKVNPFRHKYEWHKQWTEKPLSK